MIKVRSYDLKTILVLTMLKIFFLITILMMLFGKKNDEETLIIPITIFLGIIGFLSMLQILTYLLTLKKLLINNLGITIFEKFNKKIIPWNEIKLFTYWNEIVILEPNTLKVKYGNNETLMGTNYSNSNIHISLKKYKRAIKFIPKEIIEKKELLLYETTYLYKQDKYKLFKTKK